MAASSSKFALLQLSPNLDDEYLKDCGDEACPPKKNEEFSEMIGEATSLVTHLKLPIEICGLSRSMLNFSGALNQMLSQTGSKLPLIICVNTHGDETTGNFSEIFQYEDRIERQITPEIFWKGFPPDWNKGDQTWQGMEQILQSLIVNQVIFGDKPIHIVFAQCHGMSFIFHFVLFQSYHCVPGKHFEEGLREICGTLPKNLFLKGLSHESTHASNYDFDSDDEDPQKCYHEEFAEYCQELLK